MSLHKGCPFLYVTHIILTSHMTTMHNMWSLGIAGPKAVENQDCAILTLLVFSECHNFGHLIKIASFYSPPSTFLFNLKKFAGSSSM